MRLTSILLHKSLGTERITPRERLQARLRKSLGNQDVGESDTPVTSAAAVMHEYEGEGAGEVEDTAVCCTVTPCTNSSGANTRTQRFRSKRASLNDYDVELQDSDENATPTNTPHTPHTPPLVPSSPPTQLSSLIQQQAMLVALTNTRDSPGQGSKETDTDTTSATGTAPQLPPLLLQELATLQLQQPLPADIAATNTDLVPFSTIATDIPGATASSTDGMVGLARPDSPFSTGSNHSNASASDVHNIEVLTMLVRIPYPAALAELALV